MEGEQRIKKSSKIGVEVKRRWSLKEKKTRVKKGSSKRYRF